MPRKLSLVERVRSNLIALDKARGRGWRAELCRRYGIQPASLSRILSEGTQPPTLQLVEQIAEMEGMNPLTLLSMPGEDGLAAVTVDEERLLRYCRPPLMPAPIFTALLTLLAYHADEPPMERDLRNALAYMQRLDDGKRRRVLAYLVTLTEGLPPDLAVALQLPPALTEQLPSGPRRARRGKPHA